MNEIEALSRENEALKAELKQAQLTCQMAAQMSDFKAGFLARTSHELRSPLNSLIGLHQLILSGLCENPEEEREFIEQAHQSSLKLVKLIDEIVDVSKTAYGTNHLDIRPLQLVQVFEQLQNRTHLQAANRGFPLTFSTPNPDLYAMADWRRFVQLLLSLIDTSIAKMQEGKITVSAQPSPKENSLWIWIDLQTPSNIWREPADLLQNSPEPLTIETAKAKFNKEKSGPSPGMNLLLAQTLLELMGGELQILELPEAQEESTTRLQCSIPLASPESIAQELQDD
ncbi:sensor histidine kinase [Lusitaniella coriacea]|uniref:sensor histidine kinase n=1 Tax=Lusitaniella coriacea TaxID=1983105 RepID=UPI003CF2E82C